MEIVIAIVIVALVAAFVAAPFRAGAGRGAAATVRTDDPVLADLEARKQAKYREIRDTELDRAQGKLSESEFKRQNAELRAEAVAILRQIDAHAERGAEAGRSESAAARSEDGGSEPPSV